MTEGKEGRRELLSSFALESVERPEVSIVIMPVRIDPA